MPLNPPICLQAFFSPGTSVGNDYTTTMSITPQFYMANGTTNSQYNGTNVAVGMYATSNFNGQLFKIKSISSQSSSSVTAVLEDIDGLNKSIDTSGGISGGGPVSGTGYIFELNEDGLPALTAINNAPTITFPDSILGRLCYDQKPPLNERLLVAVGQGTNIIATSQDGLNWIPRTSPFTTRGYAVAWNGSIWVAVGEGTHTIATSPDGITWTGRGASIFTTLGHGVAWNGSIWVAVGQGTNTIATSVDGINWTGRGASIFTLGRGVAWNGSLWVAVGAGTNSIATSADGINWVGRGGTIFTTRGYSVAWNGSLWVAVGSGTNNIATSPDGITWTGRGTSVFSIGGGGFGIAWNGSLWVAVGAGTDSIATSPDGITWTGRGATAFSTTGYSVAWNGSIWVAVGQGTNTIATSPDGITWTGRGANIFTSLGYYVASRRLLPYVGTVTTIPKTYPTLQVYARGAGNKNPLARLVVLNGTPLSSISTTRGLTLTIINAIDLSVVSSTNYDTWGSLTDANNLGTAINNMTRQQIGILTSSDAWEGQAINSTTLQNAASRVGLTKLGEFILSGSVNRPYAAIFSGAGTDTTNVGTHDVIERMESDDADAPPASASAYIISDGTYASISGANSTNALYSANSSTKDAIVYVNSSGNMGVGTTATSLVSRLQVNDRVTDDNSFNYGSAPLSVTIPTGTSTTVLNDQLPVAHFLRQGTAGQAYGARATMALSRYENSGTNSRTRVDFQLAHTTFDTVNVMSLRSDGNVGIGTTTPQYKLDVNGTQQIARPSANGTTVTNALVLFSGQSATNGGGAAIRFDHSTGGLQQTRGAIINSLDDSGTFGQSVGLVFQTGQNTLTERMRISGNGRVGIGANMGTTAPAAQVLELRQDALGSIATTGNVYGDYGGNGQLFISTSTTPDKRLALGYNQVNDASIIQSIHSGTSAKPLTLNPSGGNVGIGTVIPLSLLHIGKGTYSTPANNTDGTSFGITFGSSNFTEQARILCVDRTNAGGTWNGVLSFHTASNTGGGANTAERMRIDGAGNTTITGNGRINGSLGVATGPTSGLGVDVNGSIRGTRSIVARWTSRFTSATNYAANTTTNLCTINFTPVQSGSVTVVISSAFQAFVNSGTGIDRYFMRISDGTTLQTFTGGYFNNTLDALNRAEPYPTHLGYIDVVTGAKTYTLQLNTSGTDDSTTVTRAFLWVDEVSTV